MGAFKHKEKLMIQTIRVYNGKGYDPHFNLAVEKYLLDRVAPGECILYLWQNQNTVVIGRNQNAWAECRTTLLESEGGKLARRLSGGGAVFHDVGNLNFTFLVRDEDYDVDRQLSVIQQACALAGIATEKSGRNDVLAEGRKFSGNAFYHHAGHAYHHGTLMVDVDKDKLGRYLSPPKAKLEAKGVASVRSRVVNLKELCPTLTCDGMRKLMIQAFEKVYGLPASAMHLSLDAMTEIEETERIYGTWEHLYGTALAFTFQCEERFDWGHITVQLEANGGTVTGAKVYSDSMDWLLAEAVEEALTGCIFRLGDMQKALMQKIANPQIAKDLCELLEKQSI